MNVLVLLYIITFSFSLKISRKQDFPNKVNQIEQFEFGKNGIITFKIYEMKERVSSQRPPPPPKKPDSKFAICSQKHTGFKNECEQMEKDCMIYNLRGLERNGTLNITINENDVYGLFILSCKKHNNLELNFTLHMTNGKFELPLDDLEDYLITCGLLVLWLLIFIIESVICSIFNKNSSLLHLIFLGILLLLVLKEFIHIYFYFSYNREGNPKKLFFIMGNVLESLCDIIIIYTISFVAKGWIIVFKHLSFRNMKILLGVLFIFSSAILAECFVEEIFFSILLIVLTLLALVPIQFTALKHNSKVIKQYILVTSEPVPHVNRKIWIIAFLVVGLFSIYFIGYILDIIICITNSYTKHIVSIIKRCFRVLAFLWTLGFLFPVEGVFKSIEHSSASLSQRNARSSKSPTIVQVADNIEEMMNSSNVIIFGYIQSLDLNTVTVDGVAYSTEARHDPLLCKEER